MNISSKDFYEAIKRVKPAVSSKHQVEILRNVCFRGGKLQGYNQQLGVSTYIGGDLRCCVPIDRIENVVRELSGTVALSVKGNSLLLSCGSFATSIKVTSADAFPVFIQQSTTPLTEDATTLLAAIDRVLPCATEQFRPLQLHGVALYEDSIYAAGDAGACFARAKWVGTTHGALLTISRDVAKTLVKYGVPDSVSTNQAVLQCVYNETHTEVVASLWAHAFPTGALDTAMSAPRDNTHDMEFPIGSHEAIQRVCAITPGKLETKLVHVEVRPGQIAFSSDVVGSAAKERLTWPGNLTADFDVRASYLHYVLKNAQHVNLSSVLSQSPKSVRAWGDNCDFQIALVMV